MQATITQNFLNCLNAYNYGKERSDATNVPTEFTNAPNVDNGLNIISMSTGVYDNINYLYTRTANPANQKLYRLSQNGAITGTSSINGYVYNFDLTKETITNNTLFYNGVVKPTDMSRPTSSAVLFTGYGSTSGAAFRVIPMLCGSDTPITLDTTDSDGDILIPESVSSISTVYNEDKSITVTYRISVKTGIANFTIKSVLFSGAYGYTSGSGSSAKSATFYNATDYPPVILWGAVLDEPIVAEAGDAIKLSVTYKTNFIA